jgi:hypothetical protein
MSVTGTWRRNAATLIQPRSPGVMSAVRRRGGQVGFRTGACVVSALRQDASRPFLATDDSAAVSAAPNRLNGIFLRMPYTPVAGSEYRLGSTSLLVC